MSRVVEITDSVQEEIFIRNNPRAVIFFGSAMCGHCRTMAPIYERLVNKYPTVANAHVETSRVKVTDLAGVPVFVGYKNGQPVDMVVGALENDLITMIETEIS